MYDSLFQQLTHRSKDSHKYNFGHVLIVGGSSGMVGAPFLAARAAMRVGAGLATIASDKRVVDKLERRVEEIMTLAVATDSAQSATIVDDYIQARHVSVLLIGSGLTEAATPLALALLKTISLPTIIDGGGLTIAAQHMDILHKRAAKHLVLTPHMGELGRFFQQPLSKSQAAVLPILKEFAQSQNLTLVIKGPNTHTITPNGKIHQNNTGGPALATAGSGDVLAGMIAGLIAQKVPPEEAAAAAVYLHGLAGDLATKELTEPGVIAPDIIDYIPQALHEITS